MYCQDTLDLQVFKYMFPKGLLTNLYIKYAQSKIKGFASFVSEAQDISFRKSGVHKRRKVAVAIFCDTVEVRSKN